MTRILVCHPTHFEVSYDINPWMSNQIGKASRGIALSQWYQLIEGLSRLASIRVLEGIENLPDLVFTANAGLVHAGRVLLSKFATPQRQPEEAIFKAWFEQNGYEVTQPPVPYEGEGDHLVDNRGDHWVGTGFRTSREAFSYVKDFVGDASVNLVELVDPRWYHLDTCFCCLPFGHLLWYPPAFSKDSQQLIRKRFPVTIDITEADAKAFACNAVCIGDHVFIPQSEVAGTLAKYGYRVHQYDLSEFRKAGGAAKCLILFLA